MLRRVTELTRVVGRGTRAMSRVPSHTGGLEVEGPGPSPARKPQAVARTRPGEVAIANEAPSIGDRRVIITAAARSAAQQGAVLTAESGAPVWRIELETTNSKWINPLMGWTSTSDVLENVNRSNLVFQTKEAAMSYAERNGWSYEVQEPNRRTRQRPKRYQGYGDNFSAKKKGLPVGGLPSESGEQSK